jgi:hypothetical protein
MTANQSNDGDTEEPKSASSQKQIRARAKPIQVGWQELRKRRSWFIAFHVYFMKDIFYES